MQYADYLALIKKKGLPDPPEGAITYATYVMSSSDWWVKVEGKGWFWLDGREGIPHPEWQPSHYGPQGRL
jgi:hypothetical protein